MSDMVIGGRVGELDRDLGDRIPDGSDHQTGFFAKFADRSLGEGLPRLNTTTRRAPPWRTLSALVGAFEEQQR